MAARNRVFMAGESHAGLRRQIAKIEGRPVTLPKSQALLPFGVEALDRLLGGGLCRDGLHEIRSETTRDSHAATGFAIAILARLATVEARPFLLVIEAGALREAGHPYGPGLDRFGLNSQQLVIVRTRRPSESLWVFEEALRCRGLAAVLSEVRGHPRQLDFTASRRLALRARESGVMGLLVRQSSTAKPGAAVTRWQASPRPTSTINDFASGIGRPVWRLVLERNRNGPIGTFDLEWNHGSRAFTLAEPARPALSFPGTSLSGDRPNPSAEPGSLVAFRHAS